MNSLAFVLAPLLIPLAVMLQAGARSEADRRLEAARTRQVAWLVALLQFAAAMMAIETGSLESFALAWLPRAGFEPLLRVEGLGAVGMALFATALPEVMRGRSVATRMSLGLMHFSASLLVAADDLVSLLVAVVLLGVARGGWLADAHRHLGGAARLRARAATREMVLAGAAGLLLILTLGAAHQLAARGVNSLRYDDLQQVSFLGGVQGQSLALVLIALAPALALWPLGATARQLAVARAHPCLRLVAPAAAALALARVWPVLAPRVGPEWAGPVLSFVLFGAALGLLAGRGVDDETQSLVAHLEAPVLVAASCIPGAWGEYALVFAVLSLALRAAQGEAGPRAWVSHATASAVPGTAGFVALACVWAALAESVEVFEPGAAFAIGAGLAVLAWGRPRRFAQLVSEPERRPAVLRERAAVLFCFLIGTLPHLVLPVLAPQGEARARERAFVRCADIELIDLRRPRLRQELSLGCSDPAAEIRRYYRPPAPGTAIDPTERLVSSLDEAPPSAADAPVTTTPEVSP